MIYYFDEFFDQKNSHKNGLWYHQVHVNLNSGEGELKEMFSIETTIKMWFHLDFWNNTLDGTFP